MRYPLAMRNQRLMKRQFTVAFVAVWVEMPGRYMAPSTLFPHTQESAVSYTFVIVM